MFLMTLAACLGACRIADLGRVMMWCDLSRQPQAAMPAPIAQGSVMGPLSTAEPLYCPPDQDGPTFLGATVGHQPIMIHCGTCGYQGWSHLRCSPPPPPCPRPPLPTHSTFSHSLSICCTLDATFKAPSAEKVVRNLASPCSRETGWGLGYLPASLLSYRIGPNGIFVDAR